MLLSSLLIAGGALAISARLYKQNQNNEKARLPRLKKSQAKNRLIDDLIAVEKPLDKKSLLRDAQSKVSPAKSVFNKLYAAQTRRFFDSDIRQQQLAEIDHDDTHVNEAEQTMNRRIGLAFVSLGMAISGSLFFAPLKYLGLPLAFYLTQFLYRESYKDLKKKRRVTVTVLITLTLPLAFIQGYFIACNIAIVLGEVRMKLLAQVKDNSSKKLFDIFKLQPRFAWILVDGVEIQRPFEELAYGDVVVVHPGETIVVDGWIVDGFGTVDQHILTGESNPVDKGVGDEVFASTTLLSGRLHVQMEKTGTETAVAEIAEVLNRTIEFKSGKDLWAEEVTDKTVLPTLMLGILSYPFIGLNRANAVINSHFGYQMSIVAPVAILKFLSIASKKGVLIKDGRTLETLVKVDTIVFDKTGTLTSEQPHVGQIHSCSDLEPDDILAIAAATESKQTHPIARAIRQAAEREGLTIAKIDEAKYQIGYGLTVTIGQQIIHVGSLRFMQQREIHIPPTIMETQELCNQQGHSLVLVSIGQEVVGAIELHATIRPEAKTVIEALRKCGIQSMYIISGDHEAPTKNLAEKLGIDHYFAQILPENKAELIEALQKEGKTVCFVGDGINDSIALKKAQVSISLSGASTIAIDTAQIILMNQSLSSLPTLFALAHDLDKNMKRSLALIFAPFVISAFGALFLNFGYATSVFFNQVGVWSGLTNAMLLSPDKYSQHEFD